MALSFASLMVKIGADIKGLSTGLATATGEMKHFSDQNKAIMRSMGIAMTAVGVAIVGGFALAVKSAADFETAITNAASVTGYAGEELDDAKDKMSALAKTLGETTVFSAKQAAEAMYDLASKGFRPAEMAVADLQPFLDLAAATQSELAMTTQTVTSTLRAFGMGTEKSTEVADIFAKTIGSSAATLEKLSLSMSYVGPIARTAGLSLEETSAALGKIYDLGFPASMAGTALRRTLIELVSPSDKMKEVLGKLGLGMNAVSTETHGFTGVLRNLDKAGASSTQILEIFGARAGPVVTALLDVDASGKKVYESMTDLAGVLKNSGGAARTMAEVQLATLQGALTEIKSAFEGIMISVGQMFIPALKEMALHVRDMTRAVGDWIKENPELASTLAKIVLSVGALSLGLGAMMLLFGPIVTTINSFAIAFHGLSAAMTITAGATKGVALAMNVGLLGALTVIVAAIGFTVKAWWDMKKAMEGATEAHEEVADANTRLAKDLSTALDQLESKYSDLSNAEQTSINLKRQSIKELEGHIAAIKADGEVTDEESAKIHQLGLEIAREVQELAKEIESREHKKKAQEENIEAEGKEANATEDLTKKFKNEAEANKGLTDQYRELNKQLSEGTVSKEEYKNKLNELVEAYGPLIGGTDVVIAKMNELDETDPHIQAKFEMFGFEEYKNTTDRIRMINQDIVLEGLTGDAKRIQSIKFELENFEIVQQRKIEAARAQYEQELVMAQNAFNIKMGLMQAEVNMKQGAEREKAQAAMDATRMAFEDTQQKGQESWNRLQEEMNRETAERQKLAHLQISNIEKVSAEKLRSNAEAKQGLGDEKDGIYDLADTYNKLAETAKTTASERMSVAEEVGEAYETYASNIDKIKKKAAKRHYKLTGERPVSQTVTTTGSGTAWRVSQSMAGSGFGFQGGSHFVPRTGDYRLHRGEKVTNAEEARAEGERVNGVGGGGVTIVNLFKEEMVPEIMAKYPNATLNIVGKDIVNRGMTRKLIQGVANA